MGKAIDTVSVMLFMRNAHAGQTRRDGSPYWTHPVDVMLRALELYGPLSEELRAAALLHDVLEDTEADIDGYPTTVVQLVKALTKRPRPEDADKLEWHKDEYSRLARGKTGSKWIDDYAVKLKVADRLCNLDDAERVDAKWLRRHYLPDTINLYNAIKARPGSEHLLGRLISLGCDYARP